MVCFYAERVNVNVSILSSRLINLLSSLMARWRVEPQNLYRFQLKNVSIFERVGPDSVSLVRPIRV